MPHRALTVSELIVACVPSDEETRRRIEMGRTLIWEAAAEFLNEISTPPISTSRVCLLVAIGDLPSPHAERPLSPKGRCQPTSHATSAATDRWSNWRPGFARACGCSRNCASGKTEEMDRTRRRWQVPSGGGYFVREGRRAPAVSGLNPAVEIDPLTPDLRGRFRTDMQERFPWFGRPPGPPVLRSSRASD
jgi:hypothetical protein